MAYHGEGNGGLCKISFKTEIFRLVSLSICTSGHPHFLELEKVLELFYEVSDLSFLCHFSCLLEGLISEENASAMMLYLPTSFLFQKNMSNVSYLCITTEKKIMP